MITAAETRNAKPARAAAKVERRASTEAAATTAVAELTELVGGAVENTVVFNPLIGLRARDVAAAAGALLRGVVGSPRAAATSVRSWAKELRAVVAGASKSAPDPKDKRFSDPAWQSNWLSRRLAQLHCVTQRTVAEFVGRSSLDPRGKARAQFFASLITDAVAPSNWLLANPVALRKMIDTRGKSVARGLRNLARDVRENDMLPAQVDTKPFQVGVNIAATPGKVVYRNEMFELLQYEPTVERVHARPLVMSPPQINKFYAVDLAREKSLVRWALDSGVQLFIVSWRNPTREHAHWGLEEYVMALDQAVDVARTITGSPDVNMWGSCAGGMTLAAYLGWLAARGERKVANTTWGVCILDTEAAMTDSMLGLFTTPATILAAKARSRRRGIVTGKEMARMFAWLRANDLIWNYWVNNYLLGNPPPAFDILFWNNDSTRLPGQFHCDLLELFEKNPYARPGNMEIGGLPIDLRQVQVGAYVIGGLTDHLTPWRGCYGTARIFGPGSTFVLANAGHLQSLVNPPGGSKKFFVAAPADIADADEWARRAQPQRVEGSWWPHWRAWIKERSGELVDAPGQLGAHGYEPLGAAPGTYVFEP